MKIILTGATGMIGEGILIECLKDPRVSEILSVSRRPSGKTHPKLKEYTVPEFLDLPENDPILAGYDACFFCAGVSSVGMEKPLYEKLTYDTTMAFAKAIGNQPQLSFVYVSGSGTDRTEKGRLHWARVKGKVENDLMKLAFKQAFGFRIGMMIPAEGQQYVLKYYNYLGWMSPFFKLVFPNVISTMRQVANAMIRVCSEGYERDVIFVKDIRKLDHM
ncbi:MAG: hypothetical protein RLZZ211_2064 [Bacteroidota bacterium]|jgi:uncharacterized protein YbjT (DUF2867 family)